MLERMQLFTDCLHLLARHTPGNELHVVPEVAVPGGFVDYFLISANEDRKVQDFVALEIQTLDTIGSVWNARAQLLQELGVENTSKNYPRSSYGINWKMSAKTILMQLPHKVSLFEAVNRHIVLVLQDELLNYIKKAFTADHLANPPATGDPVHFHSYQLEAKLQSLRLVLDSRCSTDSQGITRLLGMQAVHDVRFQTIADSLAKRISDATVFTPFS